MRHEFKLKDHRCFDNKGNLNCCHLLQYRNLDTGKIHYVDEQSKIYTSVLLFRRDLPFKHHLSPQDTNEIYGAKRIRCPKCDNLEFKTESCLETHTLTWHEDQPYEKNHRPRDHKCRWNNSCIELIEERKTDGSTKLCDSLGHQYKSIEDFRMDNDQSTISAKFNYLKDSSPTSCPESKRIRLPANERERKRKQTVNNENITSINKKPAQIKDKQLSPNNKTTPMEVETEAELMSQSLPELFYSSKSNESLKDSKEERITGSFVNQQAMKFEKIGELNNPQNPTRPDG